MADGEARAGLIRARCGLPRGARSTERPATGERHEGRATGSASNRWRRTVCAHSLTLDLQSRRKQGCPVNGLDAAVVNRYAAGGEVVSLEQARAKRHFEEAAAMHGLRIEAAPMGLAWRRHVPALDWLPSGGGFVGVRNVVRESLGRLFGA